MFFMARYCKIDHISHYRTTFGTEKIKVDTEKNNCPSAIVAVTPTIVEIEQEGASMQEEVVLTTKVELMKHFINYCLDENLVQCELL